MKKRVCIDATPKAKKKEMGENEGKNSERESTVRYNIEIRNRQRWQKKNARTTQHKQFSNRGKARHKGMIELEDK